MNVASRRGGSLLFFTVWFNKYKGIHVAMLCQEETLENRSIFFREVDTPSRFGTEGLEVQILSSDQISIQKHGEVWVDVVTDAQDRRRSAANHQGLRGPPLRTLGTFVVTPSTLGRRKDS